MTAQKKVRQAVILAGGMGLRLRPFTYDNPKAIVPVNGKPFLSYIIDELKKNGIEEIVMLLGYLPEKIEAYLGDGSSFGVQVKYSIGSVEDATGTRVRNAMDLLDDRFLLIYCDNYLRFHIEPLLAFHESQQALATMTVYTNSYGFTKNNLFLNQEGWIMTYDKTRTMPGLNGVDVGFFVLEKQALLLLPDGNVWLDKDLFPELIARKQLAGFSTNQLYYSLSTPERRAMTERFLGPQKVIFLDRDGVINKKMPQGEYVLSVQDFVFLPGAIDAIALLHKEGYEVYVVSNQAGIGRGLMNEGDLFEIHKYMEQEIEKGGGKISGIFYCPHSVEDQCKCRKPKPGLLFQAALTHYIDLPRATFIGDDVRDQEAGRAAACKTIFMESDGNLLEIVKSMISQ
jgi:D-glycero-D-manno-heptose 1,7-bisphosphate phosphatase